MAAAFAPECCHLASKTPDAPLGTPGAETTLKLVESLGVIFGVADVETVGIHHFGPSGSEV